jgi:hypothetical protein
MFGDGMDVLPKILIIFSFTIGRDDSGFFRNQTLAYVHERRGRANFGRFEQAFALEINIDAAQHNAITLTYADPLLTYFLFR